MSPRATLSVCPTDTPRRLVRWFQFRRASSRQMAVTGPEDMSEAGRGYRVWKCMLATALLGLTLLQLSGQAPSNQPVPRTYLYNLNGPFTVMAGYRSVYYFKP